MTPEQLAMIKLRFEGKAESDWQTSRHDTERLLAALEAAHAEAEKWQVHAQQTLTAFQFSREQNQTLSNEVFQAQDKCRAKETEVQRLYEENARLREALDIARKHLLNSDGFYFGLLNKTVIRSGTTQGGIERAQDGYPIGGITIHNYGQAVVQEMDAALATNETPTA